jgi:hypothetical protein
MSCCPANSDFPRETVSKCGSQLLSREEILRLKSLNKAAKFSNKDFTEK